MAITFIFLFSANLAASKTSVLSPDWEIAIKIDFLGTVEGNHASNSDAGIELHMSPVKVDREKAPTKLAW
jgi:hypothetical protein